MPEHTGRSRFSIDFRMVNIEDVKARRTAPNYDSRCTGPTLAIYHQLTDLSRIPPDWIRDYEQEIPVVGHSELPA